MGGFLRQNFLRLHCRQFFSKSQKTGFAGFRYRCIVLVATLLRSTAVYTDVHLQLMLTVFAKNCRLKKNTEVFSLSIILAAVAHGDATYNQCFVFAMQAIERVFTSLVPKTHREFFCVQIRKGDFQRWIFLSKKIK